MTEGKMSMNEKNPYEEIINLPHHTSVKHPPLGKESYAAQFSPFAALSGYDGIVSEAARFTDDGPNMNETDAEIINAKLRILRDRIKEKPEITVTYFSKDKRKSGGKYVEKTGFVKKIDEVERCALFSDGAKLPFDVITDLRSEIFGFLEQN